MKSRKSRSLIPLCLLSMVCAVPMGASAGDPPPPSIRGFSAASADAQRVREAQLDRSIDPGQMERWLRELSSAPGHVGSAHGRANAEFVLARFREFGWDASIESFDVLYPTPKRVQVQMLAPQRYEAVLSEPPVEGDASSAIREQALLPYNVYGGDGDVSGELVYANYGGPDDYAELARRGIDVRGKIVITRYGGGWRGLKPLLAQRHGAVGCLIYSDPNEDGYARGDVYPVGGFRPEQSVQRGSVADMMIYPGDPLTPGYGSVPGARRLPVAEAETILKIPVLPLSWGDATPLLKALQGDVVPESWRGALPLTYKTGPGPARVRVVVESDWGQKTIHNVIARLPGTQPREQWVIRGNHRDTWVMGAQDPLSGTVAMLAEAKALGELSKQGWRPKRTLVYASWDGEEAGLLGSTEWVETHAGELRDKAVAYINTDSNSRGFLGAGGSHSLQHMINQVAGAVTDPQTGASVGERLRARLLVSGYEGSGADKARARGVPVTGDLPIAALGSGSDYAPFLAHLGVASMNLGFGGEARSGVYHSHYDTYEHFQRFVDPGLAYAATLARLSGRIAMRLADAEILPMRFADMGERIDAYVEEVRQIEVDLRKETENQHRLLDAGMFGLAADPTRVHSPPERLSAVPQIDLEPLERAVVRLRESLARQERAYMRVASGDLRLDDGRLGEINALAARMERGLTHAPGLPGRPWYRHMVYAPGVMTGYGVKTLPGVREALEARRWEEARSYVAITAQVLDGYRAEIERLAALLEPS